MVSTKKTVFFMAMVIRFGLRRWHGCSQNGCRLTHPHLFNRARPLIDSLECLASAIRIDASFSRSRS
jgi:hypothetical protein